MSATPPRPPPPHSALGAPSLSPSSSLSLSLLYPNAPVRVFLKVEEDDGKEEKNTRGGGGRRGGGRRRRRRRRRSDGDEDASRTFTSDDFALGLLTFASSAVDAFRIVSGRGRKEGEKKKKMNKKKREPPRVSLSLLVDESIGPENRERERLNTIRRARTWHHSEQRSLVEVDWDERSSTPLPLSQRQNLSDDRTPGLEAKFSVWRLSDDRDLNESHDEYEDEFREEQRHVKRKQSFTPSFVKEK